ncbi:MAG: metallophosphoesterase [Bacteriovoracaceae bacterium]|jgi:hypothetical protein|nr:metallophosphoesterase [Bacteriovoracaceae bacterium]
MKLVLLTYISICFSLHAQSVLYLTDIEGRFEKLQTFINKGFIEYTSDGIDFTHKKTKLIFGGDLTDRGNHSIRLRKLLLNLKQKHPDKVHLILGNRDLNKLKIIPMIKELDLSNIKYKQWLQGYIATKKTHLTADELHDLNLKKFDDMETKMTYSLQELNCHVALQAHKEELENTLGKKITMLEASENYFEMLDNKNSDFWKYLRNSQISHIEKSGNHKILFIHGGLTKENLGYIPDLKKKVSNIEKWSQDLNKWAKSEINSLSENIKLKSKIIEYGDAFWDHKNNKIIFNNKSVIYPRKYKNGNNYRLPPDEIQNLLIKQNITTVVQGHSPAATIPLVMKNDNGFSYLMADTSYTKNGIKSSLIIKDGKFHIEGLTHNERKINFIFDPNDKSSPLGKLSQEYHIAGVSNREYYLVKREKNYYFKEVFKNSQNKIQAIPAHFISLDFLNCINSFKPR